MSGLYDGHTDLVVLGCQTVETAPTSAGTAGSYLIVMMYRYSTVRSSGYNLLFTLYILYSSLYQKLVELKLTVLLRSEHRGMR